MRWGTGHGHVLPREDGERARCGGPGMCLQCGREVTRLTTEEMAAYHTRLRRLRSARAADAAEAPP